MDLYAQINKSILDKITLTENELLVFNQLLKSKTVAKKSYMLRAGEVCNFEGFVNKGCLRKYYIDENGQEVIIQFAIEQMWISDIPSFSSQQPGNIYIEALEDCELVYLTPQTKEELLKQVPQFERFYRILVERYLNVLQNRLYFSLSKTAQDKYIDFLEHYPTIPQRVPQHYIASYLGMSPEFLSKLRKRMIKDK
ncbi:Crp/Fnr family transcriptional regulator [Pedobacter sp. AW31-3R]|uniref:Crp/Fnr family transcriptional regulator n=1 Tax=Pedobacter sp. AW31-3R TaxID=3445781 RepID=UPI003FA085AA